jgi:hypothetical protein
MSPLNPTVSLPGSIVLGGAAQALAAEKPATTTVASTSRRPHPVILGIFTSRVAEPVGP